MELILNQPQQIEMIVLSSHSDKSAMVQDMRKLCEQKDIPITINDRLLDRLSKSDNTFAAGIFRKYPATLDHNASHVVLVNPDDMGNIGTILRTMLGFEYRNLAIIAPAADVFHPKSIRASMGALFQQQVEYFDTIETYHAAFPAHTLYPFMLESAQPLAQTTFNVPHSLVFGNEGAGLSADYANRGTPVHIEQGARIDSLNLAVAVSVGLYKVYIS